MFMFPEVAQKAHDEIAKTVQDRLPSIGDRPSLPYTEAVWKECLRWRPGIPLGREFIDLLIDDMSLTL